MHRASRSVHWEPVLAAFLQTHLQASLPMGFQKLRSIRFANDPALALGARRWSLDSFRHGILKTHRPLAPRAALLGGGTAVAGNE